MYWSIKKYLSWVEKRNLFSLVFSIYIKIYMNLIILIENIETTNDFKIKLLFPLKVSFLLLEATFLYCMIIYVIWTARVIIIIVIVKSIGYLLLSWRYDHSLISLQDFNAQSFLLINVIFTIKTLSLSLRCGELVLMTVSICLSNIEELWSHVCKNMTSLHQYRHERLGESFLNKIRLVN